ncbi:Ionotropic receptor 21a, partial [Diabrotica virgifera virgifera]
MLLYFSVYAILQCVTVSASGSVDKRALQKSHEKSQQEKWADAFLNRNQLERQLDLVMLLKQITVDYLSDCTPIILFDTFTEKKDNLLLEKLLTSFPIAYMHGQITEDYEVNLFTNIDDMQPTCLSYLLFMKDVMKSKEVIGEQNNAKVIVIARSSQWRVFEFLSHEESRYFVNLLVIVQSERIMAANEEAPYILYTHKLYIDALGSSKPVVLSSFQDGNLTRKVDLFPKKFSDGFSGHRFIVAMSNQPPFVIFKSSEAVTRTVMRKKANIGIGGIYVTPDKMDRMGLTRWHSRDCAAFISLASTALP